MISLSATFTAERPNPKAHVSHDKPLTEILRSAFGVLHSAFCVRRSAFGVQRSANNPYRNISVIFRLILRCSDRAVFFWGSKSNWFCVYYAT